MVRINVVNSPSCPPGGVRINVVNSLSPALLLPEQKGKRNPLQRGALHKEEKNYPTPVSLLDDDRHQHEQHPFHCWEDERPAPGPCSS